jgi:tetratricopeptide (TPR) repeat protein
MPKSLDQQAMAEYERGMKMMEAIRLEDALRHFDKAVELWSGFIPARVAKANTLIMLERSDEGLAYIEQTVAEFPDDFLALYAWGSLLLADGEPDIAVDAFERAAAVIPDEADFYLMLGDGFMTVEENERGIEMLQRAVELAPRSARAHGTLGRALVTDEQYADALQALERAIKLDARYADAWYAKGLALGSLGRHDEAVKAYQRTLAIDPDYAIAYVALATTYEQSGHHDAAMKMARQAEKHAQDDAETLYSVARLYSGLEEFSRARTVIERVIENDPEDTEARLLLAGLAVQLDDMDTAMRELAYVQQNDPDLLDEMAAEAGLPPIGEIGEEDDEFEDDEWLQDDDFDIFPSRPVEPKLTVGAKGKPGTIYQLRIALADLRPSIWRQVLVPADFTLAKLHRVVQAVMDWENSHLHDFTIGTERYADPRARLDEVKNETKVPLHQVAGSRGKFYYQYDFGDCWEVEIKVEKVLPPARDGSYPICLAGENAGPPEDSGGIWGYADILEILEDPDNPGRVEILEWLGEDFDPAEFDLEEVNKRLAKIK